MNTLITLLAVLGMFGYHCVDGASCITASANCQATDYTMSACSSTKVCDCFNSTFVAIRTGCALKLDKPVISAEAGKSNQVINGQIFKLNCKVIDATNYEWYLGTTKLTTTISIHSATASSSNVGSFTCKGTTADGVLTSETSDAFKVEMLGIGGVNTSNIQPNITVPATIAINGSSIVLSCDKIPMGTDKNDISYKVNGADATSPLTINNTNAGKEVTCTIRNGATYSFSTTTSAVGKLPSLITNIQSVTVTWEGQTLTEIDKSFNPTTLNCTTTPGLAYLGASPNITYAWQKDGTQLSVATSAFYVASVPGTYSCTATLSGQTTVSSGNKVTVTFRTDQLTASASQPIKGGRVILTCGDVRYDGVTYQWAKDSKRIDRQYDRKLQIDNFDTSDDGTYACRILLSGAILDTYYSQTITTQSTIVKPTISVGGCGYRLAEMGDYWLSCDTTSETVGMTYEWTVNGVVATTVTGKYYNLPAVTISNNGNYTCKAKFGTFTSAASDTKFVVITDPGLPCYHDNECISVKIGYSSNCDHNDRCLCADGYVQKGEQCIIKSASTNGVVKVLSSLAILISACAITRFI